MSTPIEESPEVDEQRVSARLSELGVHLDPQINYRLSSLFPQLEGWGAKGAIKSKHKLLRQVEPLLKAMLHTGEEVLYVAKGTQYSFAEHYFIGIWAMTINQTVFVLTNARLLMMRTNGKGRPKETFWVLYYSEIETFKGGWTGILQLKLRDGKKLKFTGFPKLDRKTMPQVFEQALEQYRQHGFEPEVSQSLENLCCGCFDAVPKNVYECADCGITYWKPSEVALRSLVVPSWGDICLKHYLIAGVEIFGGLITWLFVALMFLAYLQNGDPWLLLGAALLVLVAHGTDAAITYYVARKGLHPKRRAPAPVPLEAD